MYFKLDEDIYTNKTQYFFSLLGPRFQDASELMVESLERRFKNEFKPIYVFSARPNKHFVKDNFIVLNKQADTIQKNIGDNVIYLQEYEDLNTEFQKSPIISKITRNLLKKQSKVFVNPFTTSFFKSNGRRWTLIGPEPDIATYFDDKIKQFYLFEELNLPRNKVKIFQSRAELMRNVRSLMPCYISAPYTSGGNENGLIYSRKMLKDFLSRLRNINSKGPFLAADIFEGIISAPNSNALVIGENKTSVLVITDQILRGGRYLGNIYPSAISQKHKDKIRQITEALGNYLSSKGYRGLFGCDFLINTEGRLVVVDLNPRRQGGYVCNMMALNTLGVNLADLELSCALNESKNISLTYEEIQYKGAWAHMKIKPYEPGQRIVKELKSSSIKEIFDDTEGTYYCTFYENGLIFIDGYIGYSVSNSKDRGKAYERVVNISQEILNTALI